MSATVVLPGDQAPNGETWSTAGLFVSENKPLMNLTTKYYPKLGDMVVGIIKNKFAESYVVDIGAPTDAHLSNIGFNAATRTNKPNLLIGDLVLCVVCFHDKDYELEVTCLLPEDKKGFMTGGNYLGELKGGCTINVTQSFALELQNPKCHLIKRMGEEIPFQIAAGANGRIWIEAEDVQSQIKIARALRGCDGKRALVQETIFRALFQ